MQEKHYHFYCYQERIIKRGGGRACNFRRFWTGQNNPPVLFIEHSFAREILIAWQDFLFFKKFFFIKQKIEQKRAKHDTNGMAKSGDPIQIGWEGWMAMEPEARIAPPEGNGEPLENMSGGRDRVHGAGSVGNCPAQGADGKDGILS